MTQNPDPTTGYRHTVYSCQSIDPDLLDSLLKSGANLSFEAAKDAEIRRQHTAWEEACETACVAAQDAGQPAPTFDDFEPNLANFNPTIINPVIVGERDNVHYRIEWFGSAQALIITRSPLVGHFHLSVILKKLCSGHWPASREDGYAAWAVPPDWLAADPTKIDPPIQLGGEPKPV